jgi:anti-sigma factor RsiW
MGVVTCREFTDFLMDYLSGDLPCAQRLRFEEHLGVCPDCVHYLQTYEATIRLGKMACSEPEDAVPADVPPDLVQGILAARLPRKG